MKLSSPLLILLLALCLMCAYYAEGATVTITGCGINCSGGQSKTKVVNAGECFGLKGSDYCQGGDNYVNNNIITGNATVGFTWCAYSNNVGNVCTDLYDCMTYAANTCSYPIRGFKLS